MASTIPWGVSLPELTVTVIALPLVGVTSISNPSPEFSDSVGEVNAFERISSPTASI